MTAFDNIPMFQGQASIVGINLLGFLISLTTNSHSHVDLLGSAAFAAGALPGLLQEGAATRVRWSSTAVIAWSVRLGSFLFYRVLKTGHDARLDEILANPVWCAGFWTYSALWGVFCSLPHSLGMSSKLVGNPLALKVGAAIFGAGLFTEVLADYQKWMFKQTNPGQFCDVGLWSISQHPNWFGNLVLWAGIFVMNAPALVEPASPGAKGIWSKLWQYRRVAVALLGPLFMWNLFEGQATGRIIGDAHEANLKKYNYGTDPAFTDYIDSKFYGQTNCRGCTADPHIVLITRRHTADHP